MVDRNFSGAIISQPAQYFIGTNDERNANYLLINSNIFLQTLFGAVKLSRTLMTLRITKIIMKVMVLRLDKLLSDKILNWHFFKILATILTGEIFTDVQFIMTA